MNVSTPMNRFVLLVATGFGLGRAPVASGTFGAMLGLPLALGFTALYRQIYWQIGIALVLTLLAVPICGFAERHFGAKDDGRIVADEYLTLPICVIGMPILSMMREGRLFAGLVLLGLAFVVSRVCDILKPTPARQSQRIPGGWGIVLDDFFASVYALVLTWGAWNLLTRLYPALT